MARVPDPENPGEFLIECDNCGNQNCEGEPECGYCGEALVQPGCEKFIDKNFRGDSLSLIQTAGSIIEDYAGQGYVLTLRQLYYQFVSRDIIPNSEKSYKRLGGLVTDARMAGLLPWDGIEDRGRGVKPWLIEESIDSILSDLPHEYAADFWAEQEYYVEVWVEKEALSNVVQRACMPLRVPYMACKGYLSASEAYRSGKRFQEQEAKGKRPLVIHLGDHDPSGIDMTRDNRDRLGLFSGYDVEVRRIALNRDQIDRYRPPPNPAKVTDSRAADYIARHGRTSWELDALEPKVVVDLISNTIRPLIDEDAWQRANDKERENKALLRGVRDRWTDIEALLKE